MNTFDKVNKARSIPMLAMCAGTAAADFQNGDICLGVSMVLYCAWWIYMIYNYFISKKR